GTVGYTLGRDIAVRLVGAGGAAGFDRLETALLGVDAYLVREIPRRDDAHLDGRRELRGGDSGRAQRVSALMAAYHAGGARGDARSVAVGWVRGAAGGPVRVIVAGDALVGGVDKSSEVMLSLPAGARGAALAAGELAGLVRGIGCWREIAGISDGLLASGGQDGERGSSAE